MITARDLLTRVIASERDPKGITVGDVMTTRLISVCPSASIDETSSLMMENRINKLPVSDPVHSDARAQFIYILRRIDQIAALFDYLNAIGEWESVKTK